MKRKIGVMTICAAVMLGSLQAGMTTEITMERALTLMMKRQWNYPAGRTVVCLTVSGIREMCHSQMES